MTTKFVPQKGPQKTWATYTFTAGYQAKPHTYGLARRSHNAFLICQKKKIKKERKEEWKRKKEIWDKPT